MWRHPDRVRRNLDAGAITVVVTGDVTQIDLPDNRRSGLNEAIALLSSIPGIAFRYFTEVDVVRHPLVQQIIKAYDAAKASPGR